MTENLDKKSVDSLLHGSTFATIPMKKIKTNVCNILIQKLSITINL